MDRKRNKKWIGIVSVALICICIVIMGNHLSKSSEAVLVASDGKTVIAHLYWKDKKFNMNARKAVKSIKSVTKQSYVIK